MTASVSYVHRELQLDEVRIHWVETENVGRPVVLLHGIGMDWRVWQAVSRRLVPHFHLFMPDLRGHGLSEKPPSGYSLAHYASDIEQLLETWRLEDATVAGSSLGGMVTAVIEAPSRVVGRRILVDPPLRRGAGPTRHVFEEILRIKSELPYAEQTQEIYAALLRDNPTAGKAYLRYMSETWATSATGVVHEALHPIETQVQIETALRSIDAPTLIMRGNLDLGSVLRPEVAHRALALLPHGEEQYFENAGHAIHGSQPEKFVQTLLDFVSRTSLAAHA